jgi:putative hydrolases of HD superfamily
LFTLHTCYPLLEMEISEPERDSFDVLCVTAKDASSMIDFMRLVGRLKTTKRTGWILRDVQLPESVSDHMYRMSLIAMAVSSSTTRNHLVKMALAHDLAEAVIGDLTPHCGVSREDKFKREEAAMADIRDRMLPGNQAGQELYSLWREYELAESPAAILMKDIDKFEMILTADEYESAQDIALDEFFDSTRDKFRTPQIQALVQELYRRRDSRINCRNPRSELTSLD